MYIDCAKFQNPSSSLFWEIAIWIYVVKSVNRDLRFSIFGQNPKLGHLKVVSDQSPRKGSCFPWSELSFDTKVLGFWLVYVATGASEWGATQAFFGRFLCIQLTFALKMAQEVKKPLTKVIGYYFIYILTKFGGCRLTTVVTVATERVKIHEND